MNMIGTMAGLAAKMKPDEKIQVQKVRVGKIPVLILKPGDKAEDGDKTAAAPALQDCYQTLLFMKKHARELGIDGEKIMVGGESAGGAGGFRRRILLSERESRSMRRRWSM